MRTLNEIELDLVSGGDGVVTTGGVLAGIGAGALVIGTGGGILVGAALGAAIWNGVWYVIN